ncbi:hypothetical protein [Marinifilum flexuosum]|uniref:Uncharacterized protein n=1 Tax=Marinifilum flexuosum TaxID=1117708 RepID=A0A419WND9_9BACT|nr:hypothetical protein [Marinifilum flexuosum]RKD96993.1 hypothetical protein BXY64_3956 [Marinifilum flexuosum]
MENIEKYNHLIEKEIEKYKKESNKVLTKFEKSFSKGKMVVTHHFENVATELIRLVKTDFENAGYYPEFIGNRPGGHIVLRVSLLKSSGKVA